MGIAARGGQNGYVLLDVLAALAIVLVGLSVLLGDLGAVQRAAARSNARSAATIEKRNADAKELPRFARGR
jgi:hypothetical protein